MTTTSTLSPLKLFNLQGKVALMTGASSGIGRHLAGRLALAGATGSVAARRVDRLETLVKEIQSTGGHAHAVELDVSNADSVRACFDQIETLAGAPDIVVSNAGTTVAKPLLDQTEADWDTVIDTNLKGVWLVGT